MKELSIEEKAKRYDEVIAMAKECITYIPDEAVNKYMLNMFPELKESEDKRIRNRIYNYINVTLDDNESEEKEKWLAWLEKQTPVDKEEVLKGARRGVALSIMDFIETNTQGMCMSNIECKNLEDAVVNSDWAKVYAFMKLKLDKQGAQKQEWSEEDEKMIESAIQLAHEYGRHGLWFWLKSLYLEKKPQDKSAHKVTNEEKIERDLVDIDKACEWLKENVEFYSFPKYQGEDLTDETYISDNLFNDFRKAMKEEKVENANEVEPKYCKDDKEQKTTTAWIARDKNEGIYLYGENPKKLENSGAWLDGGYFCQIEPLMLPSDINPKWEDKEPIEVELTIRRKE